MSPKRQGLVQSRLAVQAVLRSNSSKLKAGLVVIFGLLSKEPDQFFDTFQPGQ